MESSAWEEAGPEHRERVASLAELGVMTASLLHELRQPLFVILAHTELAVGLADPELAVRLRVVLEQARHIEALLAKYSGVGRDGEDAAFDLRAPVQSAVEMFEYRARQLGARLKLTHGGAPLVVRSREHALKQVAINLLQNALDAVEGRPEREVAVHVEAVGPDAVLSVVDSGCGVPEELRQRVFDAFVSSKPPERGTGLGLYITRLIAQNAGGDVTLEAHGAQGTRVSVRVPLV
jgi:two-component system C4-dicarboxylate transport sensor histidine kinase DctB